MKRRPSSEAESASEKRVSALDELRREIDRVDLDILENLNQRARLVLKVGELKQADQSPVYVASRERDLVADLVDRNAGPFPSAAIPHVFREVVSATRSLEAPVRVAYLGPEASFSHLAALQNFGSGAELVPVGSIAEVFEAVERGRVELGMVPIENTTEGVVNQSLDRFADSPLVICAESLLAVSHDLMSLSGRLEDVRRVASHPQPLAQCREWLDRNLPQAERVPTASTSVAASQAAADGELAAIGSSIAAEQAGLRTIAAGIQDRADNTTRFVVVGTESPAPSGDDLTSMVCTLRKDQAGALHHLLEPFARNGVNLTTIQSRPMRGRPWEYLFFINLQGHLDDAGISKALAEASGQAHWFRVLGSYPRATQTGPRGAER